MIKLSIHCLFCLERGKRSRYKTQSQMLFLLVLTSFQILTSAENIQLKQIHKDVEESVLSGNNSRLIELSNNNEQVAYNQLLPYLESKLPIPISLMNQLRKYNINRNMLNKIHSYNLLRRELHGKLIENEIDNAKYSEVMSKKFQSLFKSVTQEERKNFLNLINYLKMFNFDNKKLYDTLHNGNDLLKLINDNKIKYLPFMNTDKKLPDLFTNNKINNEIKSILIQYKISSKDLYNKLINKINPVLLEDMNKNTQLAEPENKIEDIASKNPYNILREKIQELTSFDNKPRIIPLNEPLPKVENNQNVQTELKNTQKKQIDKSLDKYIKDLQLLNEIEKERDQIINTKIDELVYPNKNVQKIGILHLQRNPIAELVALYLVMSGVLSASPNNMKRLPHIKKPKEDILPQSHVEAGRLYNYLMNKNVKDSLNKIQNIVKKNKHLEKLDDLNDEMNGIKKIDISPFENNKDMKINGETLFSALKNKQQPIKVAQKKHYAINGNKMFDVLSKKKPEHVIKDEIEYKMNGNHMLNLLHKTNDKSNLDLDNKADGTINENKINSNNKAKEPVLNKHAKDKNNANQGEIFDGNILYNLLKQDNFVKTEKDIKHKNDEEQGIKGNDLFNILNPNIETNNDIKYPMNFNKFYEKLYNEFSKDNQGAIDALHTKKDQHKVLWNDQNVEIPNISGLDFNDKKKNNIKAENVNSDKQSNEAPEG